MELSLLKIKGFKSFGPKGSSILINQKLIAFIGLNSTGKTAALEALRKIFGSSLAEREIYRQDFHLEKGEIADEIKEKDLSIEVRLDFSDEEKESIPHFFSYMIVDDPGSPPYIRLRLEATWKSSELVPDGEVDSKIYFIKVAQGEEEEDDDKQIYPSHFKSLIQILYVPAIRRPSEQLKYASGTILYRVLKKIKWNDDFKNEFNEKIEEINDKFKGLPEFNTVQTSINDFWKQFHKDDRYQDTNLGFGGSDFDSILKKLEVSFSPSGAHRDFTVDELGEGYRSLFYFTLVCALLDVEEKLIEDKGEEIGIHSPLLTILAIEEPENHIAPQLLGRVITILRTIADKENSQVLLSSHTPAIVKRLDPESIFHFRITTDYKTEVNTIILPDKADEAYKYVRQAVHNFPEIYFAKLVVIGEGDSEKIIFDRFMQVMNTDFDDNLITFAPLGHRFVNHIWKLLETLKIPYVTLLDLDLERNGGGWGRIKYVLNQLLEAGFDKDTILALKKGSILSDKTLADMHKRDIDIERILKWIERLKTFNVFFSAPLDLDFLMLQYYIEFYNGIVPKGGGPKIPDKTIEPDAYSLKVESSIKATLKSNEATGEAYSDDEKALMIDYNYHFLGRGKPSTHIQALANMNTRQIKSGMPPVFKEIFERISMLLAKSVKDDESH